LDNPAIIWQTPLTDVNMLNDLLDRAIQRSGEIEQFKQSFSTGQVEEDYPDWIRNANERINPAVIRDIRENNSELSDEDRTSLIALEELTSSEYGLRIANEYSALNNVVAGGTRMSAKNLSVRNRSLLDTLEQAAGWRSIIRFQADDYKDAYAHVFVGYLMANMGDLDESLVHFNAAKDLMDAYPADKNLAIFRNTPDLSQEVIQGLINSSIVELSDLNNDPGKYSAGWWKRLTYYNQSIGGQANPSITDMSEAINDRYYSRMFWSGLLGFMSFYIAGFFGKKLKLSEEYEVKPEE